LTQDPDYDVIIAGGGMSGLLTAASVGVYSKQNARILVVDRNPPTEPGKKTVNGWTCGDATSKTSLGHLAKTLGIRYGFPELEHPVEGVLLFSPDHQTRIVFEGAGFMLNRKLLARRQVEDARNLGVEFAFGVALNTLSAEGGWIRGVAGKNKDGSTFKKTARVVVDSSGSATRLRRSIPIDCKIEKEIGRDDIEITGRYIYDFDPGVEDGSWFDPKYAIIHFDQNLAPGGYCWTFPKGKNKVNIGLGVQKAGLDARNKRLNRKDTLQGLIDAYVRSNKAIKNPVQSSGERDLGNTRGNWVVPVRRHNDCLVANGYALIGDAAWMTRPIDAGGIGPSIYASVILGRIIAAALDANDASEAGLWGYNVEYMRLHGYQMASFEILRTYLQALTNDQISYGMKHFLSEDDVAHVGKRQHPEFDRTRRLNPLMWLRILAEPNLARGLRFTAKKSRTLIAHNLDYPETPARWQDWKRGLDQEMREAFSRFKVRSGVIPFSVP
jgi:digeranylgeranylglycerophospholipid reductase